MIISASRRTDIPAFYSPWFMNRIRAGYCTVVNPYNRKQISYVALLPEDVEVIVFWTKNPQPLIQHLPELDARGFRYYFQYTLTGYPTSIEPNLPEINKRIDTFKKLADLIGPAKVIWRYDPIILSNITDAEYHQKQVDYIARRLAGNTQQLIVSIVDEYRKAKSNFDRLTQQNIFINRNVAEPDVQELIKSLLEIAQSHGLEISSCAETLDLAALGLKPGKCIDEGYISRVFGQDVPPHKDKHQRLECGCVVSKDIGAYDTCRHGCLYCYAGTRVAAEKNRREHYSDSPSLIGRFGTVAPQQEKSPGIMQPSLDFYD